jgi:large subunit ribosomal protein L13
MVVIDAKHTLLGRVSSIAAKQALLGHNVEVINCEEAVVSGRKFNIVEHYERRIDRKAPLKGPFLYRRPDMFVRRTIRGMLPWKNNRGREAFKLIKCHVGVPETLKNEKTMDVKEASMLKLKIDHLKVKDICIRIGGKRN